MTAGPFPGVDVPVDPYGPLPCAVLPRPAYLNPPLLFCLSPPVPTLNPSMGFPSCVLPIRTVWEMFA